AGVRVDVGLMTAEATEAHRGFLARMTRGRPWMRLKAAASLDGRIALANGESRWITGEAARRDAHALRARSCAMLTGIGTVLRDDPELPVRHVAVSLPARRAQGLFALPEWTSLDQALRATIIDVRAVGNDIRVTARFSPSPATPSALGEGRGEGNGRGEGR